MQLFTADSPEGEHGIFLSLEEFIPYYCKGWRGTDQTNRAAWDWVLHAHGAEGDRADNWWMKELSSWDAETKECEGYKAIHHMLAFHCID